MVKFMKTAREAYAARQETRKEMRKNTGGKNRIRRFLYGGMAFSALACCALLLTGLLYSGSGRAMPFGLQNPHDRGIAEKQAERQSRAVAAAADGNWGLSFQQEGSAPIGNATPEYLAKFQAYYIGAGDPKAKKIYLTFDAGYENGVTEKLLDVLKEEEVPAAFFVVGNFIEENPQIIQRMEAEGHVVGNHTMHHPDMSAIADEADFQKELAELEAAYQKVTGKAMKKFYRPPQGKYSEENLTQANKLGYTTVFWSLAYVDWLQDRQPTREEALNLLNKRIHPQAIVLLHSTSKTNGEILKELIEGWKARGYTFCSIAELGTRKL